MAFQLSQIVDNLSAIPPLPTFRCERVKNIARKVVVANFGIERTYQDFRDTMARYYLYLPYADTIELENYKILGKTLSIEVLVDVRTGNLKWFVLADGCIVATVGGCARIDFPISATNPMGQSAQIRSSASSLVNGLIDSAVTGARSMKNIGSSISNNGMNASTVGTIASGIADSVQGLTTLAFNTIPQGITGLRKPSPTTFSSNYTSGTCCDDPRIIYLYKVMPNIEIDDGIRNNYGLPANRYDTIANHKGYVQIDDVKLKGNIPVDDKAEIIATLKNGIYVL